jgi:hypothetical protein
VSNTEPTGQITASPNPIPFGQRGVMISWVTNDPRGGEIRVAASAGEKLVTRGGESGHIEIAWIVDSTIYDFRLYGGSRPDTPIDSVKVRRDFSIFWLVSLQHLSSQTSSQPRDAVLQQFFVESLS